MQSGNDFLPSIPSLENYGRPSGLDILLKTYKEQLPQLGGSITNGVAIDPDRLKRMLTRLAEDEEDSFKRASVCDVTLAQLLQLTSVDGSKPICETLLRKAEAGAVLPFKFTDDTACIPKGLFSGGLANLPACTLPQASSKPAQQHPPSSHC